MESKLAYGRAQLDRAAPEDGPLTFVASSTALNRYGYALRNDGWRLDSFNANPVVLWMHNPFMPPIGHGRAVSKDGQVLLENVVFDREDELARAVESKYRRGFLNAVSVGFDIVEKDGAPILDWWRLSNEDMQNKAFYDLAEVSAVSVPADPQALRTQSRLALSKLGRELVDLFDEKEHGTATAIEVEAAVRAELMRLGITPTPTDDAPVGIEETAARAFLAALDGKGIPHE